MEELNRRGKEFIDEWCNEKHGTTKRIPNEHFLIEEKRCLLPLPPRNYRMKNLTERKISPDCFININSNKYSVPAKYACKKMKYRIIYGFRIEIYDSKENLVLSIEEADGKHGTYKEEAHYEAIAPKVSTSIPQIKRDFTAAFSNGLEYLKRASQKFDQPTHYARKILLYSDIYDSKVLDQLLGVAIERDTLGIKDFRKILKEYNSGELKFNAVVPKSDEQKKDTGQYQDDDPKLLRECSYYEDNISEVTRP